MPKKEKSLEEKTKERLEKVFSARETKDVGKGRRTGRGSKEIKGVGKGRRTEKGSRDEPGTYKKKARPRSKEKIREDRAKAAREKKRRKK